MNKEELLIVITNTEQKLLEVAKNPNNTRGNTKGVAIARALIEKSKLSVEGTEDSPIFGKTFDEIAASLPSITSNLDNHHHGVNQANNILGHLVKLALPESVTAVRKTNETMRKSLESFEGEIKKAKISIAVNDEAGQKLREKHQTEYELIEKTHNEQLQFEAPVTTWSNASTRYSCQGWLFMGIVLFLTTIACYFLYQILLKTPLETWDLFSREQKGAAVRWSVVLVALAGFVAYVIRSATRAMFSAFHLSRDAGERALLAQFYLGLINKGALDPSDRAIVMQSLFSRSDTGLLKDDGSPTMAGDLVAKISSNKTS
jgi:hypothetical protein